MTANTRIKVLILIRGLGLGGAERLLGLALPYLDQDRYHYEVAYLTPGGDELASELRKSGVKTTCLKQSGPLDLLGFIRLISLMRSLRPDVVHMHGPYVGAIGSLAAKIARIKCTVYTEHSAIQRRRWIANLIHRYFIGRKDSVVCVSNAVREAVTGFLGIGSAHPVIRTIYNGVDWKLLRDRIDRNFDLRAEFGIPAGHEIVVNVANLRTIKRHEDLILAARRVVNVRPNVTFIIVGEGDERPALERLVHTLGLRKNVMFVGIRDDAPTIVANSDLFVLPSDYEGLGVAALEALALGIPVVATRVGGIPEIIREEVDGLLVEPRDPAGLAIGIIEILSNPDLRKFYGESSKIEIEQRFSIQRMVGEVEAVYAEVLESKTGLAFV